MQLLKTILLWISRLLIGFTFIFSGFVKAIDPVGSAIKFEDYFTALHLDFLGHYGLMFAMLLAAIEFLLGVNPAFACPAPIFVLRFGADVDYDSVYALSGIGKSGDRLWLLWRCRKVDQLGDIQQKRCAAGSHHLLLPRARKCAARLSPQNSFCTFNTRFRVCFAGFVSVIQPLTLHRLFAL